MLPPTIANLTEMSLEKHQIKPEYTWLVFFFFHFFRFYFISKWGSNWFEYRTRRVRASARRSRERAGSSVVAEWGWLQAVWSCCTLPRRSVLERESCQVIKLGGYVLRWRYLPLRRLRIRWQNFIFAYPRLRATDTVNVPFIMSHFSKS